MFGQWLCSRTTSPWWVRCKYVVREQRGTNPFFLTCLVSYATLCFLGTIKDLLNFNGCFALFLRGNHFIYGLCGSWRLYRTDVCLSCGKYAADYESELDILLHFFIGAREFLIIFEG